jgi:protein-tyrosine-phosphatase
VTTPLRLLFVCVENSCRSQMAEALARMAGHDASSAGSRPSGVVNPKAIASMAELDYDLSGHSSEGVDALAGREFDAVVTMGCGDACPHVPARVHEDWPIPDPKHMQPAGVAEVRDEIARRVEDLVTRLAAPA